SGRAPRRGCRPSMFVCATRADLAWEPSRAIRFLLTLMKPHKAALLLCLSVLTALAAEQYQKPPKAVLDVLNSPTIPTLSLSPTREYSIEGQPVRYPPIAELSQPMQRLAGLRINPKTNGLHNTTFNSSLLLRKVPEGSAIKVDLLEKPKISGIHW